VAVNAEVLGKPVEEKLAFELPDAEGANPEIERAWASHRVARLMDEDRRSGTPGAMRKPIVQLCEDYSIVSEYASFIVLENDAEYQRWAIERKNSTRLGRDRAALDARRDALRVLREKAVANLGPDATTRTTAVKPAPGAGVPSVDAASQSPTTPDAEPQFADSAPRPSARNFDFGGGGGGGGGGGAIDPVSGVALLSIAGLGAWTSRRRTRRQATHLAHAAE
jgi:MprA protease rhombosortase-interaction domain-containing protein